MKFIPIVGIGLAIWGLVTLDWFKVGIGIFLFFLGFVIDLFKKRGAMSDDKVFAGYKALSQLTLIVRKSLDSSGIDSDSPKAKLAKGLYFLGMVDAASQSAGMDDRQFLDLFKSVFADMDYEYDKDYQSKLIVFHQNLNTEHAAFPAIMKGEELFLNFTKGNSMAPMAGGMQIEELIEDDSFPGSIEQL
ncbi:MAG: hypothetical protein KZQ80_17595 [Candidatus Thiodiazotropha sp. (ex Monitilora ramsayi)]|nr:hypothetical protein [Candidatus Thiodiazotropha sp. (ex Monitilora ramsayi)]